MLLGSLVMFGVLVFSLVLCGVCCCCCCRRKKALYDSSLRLEEPINEENVGLLPPTPKTNARREELTKKYGLKSSSSSLTTKIDYKDF